MSNPVYPRTAIVKVSGYRRQVCDSNGECRYRLMVTNTQIVDPNGSPVTTEAGLERTDETYFTSRGKPLPPVTIDPAYSSSIINSIDQEVSPAIQQALVARGLIHNVAVGSIVLVTFADGTKAMFTKQCTCTDMWRWTGQAWDKDGNLIRRNGSRIYPSARTGASSGGQVETSATGTNAAWLFALVARNSCQASVTFTLGGGGYSSTVWYNIPC